MLGADPSRRCWERVRTRTAISPRANRCVRAGEAVGVCCARSVELVVGALAVILSGASYCTLLPELPAKKQQLNREHVGFLRDELSLAHYNVGPGVVLALSVRGRGGRKK